VILAPYLALALIAGEPGSGVSGPASAAPHPGRIVFSPNWSDYRNYPIEARRSEQEGGVVFALQVDRTGKSTSCTITQSSNSPSLDAGTCALAIKMQFEPAHGADGEAIESVYSNKVFWLLDSPRPLASSTLDAELTFDGERLTSCTVKGQGPYFQPWKSIVCRDAQIFPEKLKGRGSLLQKATVSLRLDAGDGLLTKPNWPAGKIIARDFTSFSINSDGDAAKCSAEADGNIFTNDFRSQDPCGHFLSTIWFQTPDKKDQLRRGQFEFRLIARTND
jgi:TonB family protein